MMSVAAGMIVEPGEASTVGCVTEHGEPLGIDWRSCLAAKFRVRVTLLLYCVVRPLQVYERLIHGHHVQETAVLVVSLGNRLGNRLGKRLQVCDWLGRLPGLPAVDTGLRP
jgi:hypothetical protein